MRLKEEGPRPRIKISLSSHDYVIEFIALSFLIIIILLPILFAGRLPDRIPVHFNASGTPDGYGGKNSLWMLPATGAFVYLLLTVLQRFPYVFNFPVKITAENAEVQYRLATRLLRILKTVILILFTFISWMTIKTATGGKTGLGKVFLPVFLLLTFGTILIYFVQARNNSNQS